jgi:hypothetical protein
VEAVKEITTLVAEPLLVDELSLIRDEPVRVKVRCRKPEAINGDLEFFFNGEGVFLRFEVEDIRGAGKGGQGGPPPGPGKPDGAFDKDKDHHSRGDQQKKSNSKFDRFGRLNREFDSSHDGSMEEPMEKCAKGAQPVDTNPRAIEPIAVFHPELGFLQINKNTVDTDRQSIIDSGAQNLQGTPLNHSKGESGVVEISDDTQFVVHGRDGPYFMEKSKWPSLRLPSKTENVVEDCTEGLTQEDSLIYKRDSPIRAEVNDQQDNSKMGPVSTVDETDVMDRMSMQSIETDRDEEETGWQIHESRKKKRDQGSR